MKFRHKNGGICEVETVDAVNKLKNNSEFKELKESRPVEKEPKFSEEKG